MNNENYSGIINMPHHKSITRQPMSMHDRAAQFAPFAALKGYEEAVIETSRITDKKVILDDELIKSINITLNEIQRNIASMPMIEVEYFVKDKYKDGGEYVTKIGNVKKIDLINKSIMFVDRCEMLIEDVVRIVYIEKSPINSIS